MSAAATAGVWAMRILLLLAAAWTTVYSLGPRPDLLPWDKAEHFLAAFGLFLLLIGAFPRAPLPILAVVLATAIAGSELAQIALPSRAAGVADGAAGMLGLGAGILAATIAAMRGRVRAAA